MSEIPNFWDMGPHNPLAVEKTWHKFVKSIGGQVVEEILPASPSFENADYIFTDSEVVAALK